MANAETFHVSTELAAEFISRPQNQEVVEGEKAEFVCSVSKDTYEVKWRKGDQELQSGDKYDIISDGKKRVLVIKSCELKDEGGFVAVIGTTRASADLTVIGVLTFLFLNAVFLSYSFNRMILIFCCVVFAVLQKSLGLLPRSRT